MPSGSITGDQCAVPATRPNGSALSGLRPAADLAVGELDVVGQDVELLRRDAGRACRASVTAAMCAATAVPGEKRHE